MVRTSQSLPEIIPAALHLETEIGDMHFCLLLVRMRTGDSMASPGEVAGPGPCEKQFD